MGKGFSDYVPIENLPDELSAVYGARSSQTMDASLEQARLRASRLQVLSDQYNAPLPGQGLVDQLKQTATQFGNAFLNADFAKSNVFNLASQGASGLASMLPDTSPVPTKYGDVHQSPLATVPINAARGVLTGASKYLGGIGQAQATMGQGNILQDPVGTGMNIVGGAASGFASAVPFNAYSEVASETAKATLPDSAQQPLATLPVVGDVTLPGMIGLGASLKAPLSGGEKLLGDLTGKALSKGLGVVRNATRGLFDKASLGIPGAGTLARDNELLVASISTQLEDAIAQTNTSLETLRKIPVSSGRVPLRQLQETESVETGLVLTKSLIDAGFHPSDVSNLLDATVFNSSNSQFSRGAGAWEPLASKPEIKTLRDSLAKVSELPKTDLTASNSTLFLHGSPNPYDTVSPSSLNPFDRDGIGLYLTDAREIAQQYAGNSGQLRQVRVPNTFDILDVNNLTSPDFEAIASALNTMRRNGLSSLERVMTGTDLEQGFKASKFADPNDPGALVRYINNLLPTSSRVATDAISPSMQQPNLATGVLALAGYDGLRFMHPAGDMAGEAYRALSIFPTSLNMIQNAETKQWMGASLGGLADRFLPKAPGAERAAGAAVGGVTGFMNPEGLSQGLPGTQDQGSNAGTPQEPTLGQRIAGGVTGAVIGSQVPGALRKALGREGGQGFRIPGAGVVEPPYQAGRDIIGEQIAAIGKRTPGNTNKELDALTLNLGTRVNRMLFDRLEPLRNVSKAAEGAGYSGESAYQRARLLPGSLNASTQFVQDNIAPAITGFTKAEMPVLDAYMSAVDLLERTMTLGMVESDRVTARATAQGRVPTAAELATVQKMVDDRLGGSTFDVTTLQSTRFGPGTSQVTNLEGLKAAPMRQIEDSLLNSSLDPTLAPRVKAAAQQLADANDKLRLQQLEAGLWSQEEYDFYKANMPNYVRYDVENYLATKGSGGQGQGINLSVQDRFLDHMSQEGTALNRQSPVASLVGQSSGVINRVERNKIAQTLEEYRQVLPELDSALREVQPATTPGSPAPPRAVRNPTDEVFTVWRDGKPVEYYVDKAYTNLWNVPSSALPAGLQIASKLLGVEALKAGATTLNLGWLPLNVIRDAWLTTLRNSGPGRAGAFKTARELGVAYADLLGRKELASAAVGGVAGAVDPNPLGSSSPTTGERIGGAVAGALIGGNAPRALNAARRLAGRTVPSAVPVADAQQLARLGVAGDNIYSGYSPAQVVARIRGDSRLRATISEVKDQVKLQEWTSAINQALNVPGAAINDVAEASGLSNLSAKVEAAPRLAQFRLSRDAGKSDISSALDARNVTMDFDRMGVLPRVINQIVPFFNVAVQGGENLIRRDFAKGNRTATAISFALGVALPKLTSEAWNRSQFPNEYAEVPDYIKDSSIVIMLGRGPNEANGNLGPPQFLRIPLPQEVQTLSALITTATDKMVTGAGAPEEGKTVPRGWGGVLESLVGSLTPLQGTGNPTNFASYLPPVAKGLTEVALNKDTYRNLSIVPDPLHALPPENQTRPWTTALAKALGRVFGTSPAYVEHLITSVSGGTGQQLLDAGDTLSRATGIGSPATSPQRRATGVPGLDSLVGAFYRQQGGQDVQALRDKARNDIKLFSRQAIAYLEALPSFQSSDPATQEDQRRKLANAVEQMIIDVQRAGVFTSAKTTPQAKYLMSESPAQDLIFEKSVQKVRAYEEAIANKLPPSAWPPAPSFDDRFNAAMAINSSTNQPRLNPGYKIQDTFNKRDIETALNATMEKVYNR
ncbi:MAG: LPD38 domain-containing protein [bacterium]